MAVTEACERREAEGLWHQCPPDPRCPHCGDGDRDRRVSDWPFVDAAYCISLPEREDRAAAAAAEFHRVGLCRKTVFLRPKRHPTSTRLGIWQSHRAVATHALDAGQSVIVVFEDDVRFSRRITPRRVAAVGKALDRLPPEWMLLFLGHWPVWAYFVAPNLLRCGSGSAHAYIASERTLRWLRDTEPGTAPVMRFMGRGIDSAYARLPGAYAIFPMLAIQAPIASDNKRKGRRIRKPRHLISRSRYREHMLSALMRPNEYLVAALSPLFFIMHHLRQTVLRGEDEAPAS